MIGKRRTSDARLDLALIVEDVGACPDRAMITTHDSCVGGWDGLASLDECSWFTHTFIDSAEENGRLWRGVRSVRKTFQRRAQRYYERTGVVLQLDEQEIEEIARGVMHAMYPSNYEIATGAKNHSVERASAAILRLIPEERWQKRY